MHRMNDVARKLCLRDPQQFVMLQHGGIGIVVEL
jgi:hypothetical protein